MQDHSALHQYENVYDIISDFMKVRLKGYSDRKKFMVNKLEHESKLLTNKARFILEQCEDTIDLRKKKKIEVINILKERNYDIINDDEEYKYLRSMRIEQVEEENMNRLLKERDDKLTEINILKQTSLTDIWKKELLELKKQFSKYQSSRNLRLHGRNKD